MSRPTQSTKAQTWKQHFTDFERSQLTVAEFYQSIGYSTPTFYRWKRKLAESNDKVAFLRVQTTDRIGGRGRSVAGVGRGPVYAGDQSRPLLFTYRAESRIGGGIRSGRFHIQIPLYLLLSERHSLAAPQLAEFSNAFFLNVMQCRRATLENLLLEIG